MAENTNNQLNVQDNGEHPATPADLASVVNNPQPDNSQGFQHIGFTDDGHPVGELNGQTVSFSPDGGVQPYNGAIALDAQGNPNPTPMAGSNGAANPPSDQSAQLQTDTSGYVRPPVQQPGNEVTPPATPLTKTTSRMGVTKGVNLDAEQAAADVGAKTELSGIRQSGRTAAEAAAEQSAILDAGVAQQQKLQAQNTVNENLRRQRLDEDAKSLSDSIANLSTQTLDPNRLYKNMSTFQSIGAAISMALGGISQGMNGGTNTAVDVMQHAVDRDIEAQRQDFQKAKDLTSAKATLYSHNMQDFNDERSAEAATRLMYWTNIKQQVEAKAAQYDPQMIGANTKKLIGAAEQQIAKSSAEFTERRSDKINEEFANQGPMTVADRNKQIAGIKEEVNKDPEFKDYGNQIRGLRDFDSYVQNGRAGAAMISMLSDDFMKGGRFSTALGKQMNKGDAISYAKDYLATFAGHPENSPILQQFRQGMKDRIAAHEVHDKAKVEDLKQRASQLGVDHRVFFNSDTSQPLTQAGSGDKKL